jgi:hypothetical protein
MAKLFFTDSAVTTIHFMPTTVWRRLLLRSCCIPLRFDDSHSQAVGFEKPILHGLCTFGMACKAVMQVA